MAIHSITYSSSYFESDLYNNGLFNKFICVVCHYSENADLNAAKVIAKRGVKEILAFSKAQSESSESPPVGTRECARSGTVRRSKQRLVAARNSVTSLVAEISANC